MVPNLSTLTFWYISAYKPLHSSKYKQPLVETTIHLFLRIASKIYASFFLISASCDLLCFLFLLVIMVSTSVFIFILFDNRFVYTALAHICLICTSPIFIFHSVSSSTHFVITHGLFLVCIPQSFNFHIKTYISSL